MRAVIAGLLFAGFFGCGAIMTYWYFVALIDWLGGLFGTLVGLFFIPGVAVFPLIFWFVEGVLPTPYLAAWLAGIVCSVAAFALQKR